MAYKTFWYKENSILFTEILGELTEDDMFAFNQEYNEVYITDPSSKIYLICDLRSMDGYPKKLKMIKDATQKTANNPGLGWIILIGMENPFVKFLATTVFQLVRVNCKIVASLEEAEKLIERLQITDFSSHQASA